MDDDSWVLERVSDNLVELFRHKGYVLGAQREYRDHPTVTWGLPEVRPQHVRVCSPEQGFLHLKAFGWVRGCKRTLAWPVCLGPGTLRGGC